MFHLHNQLLGTHKSLFGGEKKLLNLTPDKYTNAIMLKMYSKSKKKTVANLAQKFFDSLDPDCVDTIAHNTLLHIWAGSHARENMNKEKALSQVLEVYNRLVAKSTPDEVSYYIAMRACTDLSVDQNEREMALKKLFDDARERG